MHSLDTRINELIFPKGCQTIPSALKRTGCETLGEVVQYIHRGTVWPGVGNIRLRLIRDWFKSETGVDILKKENG